jgi:cytochrome P450
MLQWIIDNAQGEQTRTDQIVARFLMVNFASIHTTTMVLCLYYSCLSRQTFTNALYDLAIYPEHVAPLREEVETHLANEGWHKSTFMKMRKLDSFLKESLRCNPGVCPTL